MKKTLAFIATILLFISFVSCSPQVNSMTTPAPTDRFLYKQHYMKKQMAVAPIITIASYTITKFFVTKQ